MFLLNKTTAAAFMSVALISSTADANPPPLPEGVVESCQTWAGHLSGKTAFVRFATKKGSDADYMLMRMARDNNTAVAMMSPTRPFNAEEHMQMPTAFKEAIIANAEKECWQAYTNTYYSTNNYWELIRGERIIPATNFALEHQPRHQ